VQCHFCSAWSYCTAPYITSTPLHTQTLLPTTLSCRNGLLRGWGLGLVEAFGLESGGVTVARMRCRDAMRFLQRNRQPADKIHAKEGSVACARNTSSPLLASRVAGGDTRVFWRPKWTSSTHLLLSGILPYIRKTCDGCLPAVFLAWPISCASLRRFTNWGQIFNIHVGISGRPGSGARP
jgi:hypothetical protein